MTSFRSAARRAADDPRPDGPNAERTADSRFRARCGFAAVLRDPDFARLAISRWNLSSVDALYHREMPLLRPIDIDGRRKLLRRNGMMRRLLAPGAVAAGLVLASCTNPYDPGQRAVGGGLIGAGTGAAIGGAVGGGHGAALGAAIGGATGAVTGAATTPPPPPPTGYGPGYGYPPQSYGYPPQGYGYPPQGYGYPSQGYPPSPPPPYPSY